MLFSELQEDLDQLESTCNSPGKRSPAGKEDDATKEENKINKVGYFFKAAKFDV